VRPDGQPGQKTATRSEKLTIKWLAGLIPTGHFFLGGKEGGRAVGPATLQAASGGPG